MGREPYASCRDLVGLGAAVVGRGWTLAQVAPGLLLGLYIVVHGHLTPGGGFQGGVVLAGVLVLLGEGRGEGLPSVPQA